MAGPLITNQDIRDSFSLDQTIQPGPIDESIGLASVAVQRYVGATAYADAAATDPEDVLRATMLKGAESRLVMYYLVLNLASGARRAGLISSETDAAGPLGGTVLNKFKDAKEVRELRAQYAQEALDLMAA